MCCDLCPKYEDCFVKNGLKDNCCKTCPDYNSCYPGDEEEADENWDE